MRCEPLTDKQFKSVLAQSNKKYLFTPQDNDRSVVRFEFNLKADRPDDTLFIIKSRIVKQFGENRFLYIGPYRNKLDVTVDSRLINHESFDNINFILLKLKDNQMCGWANSLSYPYWKSNNKITIDFLEEKRIDENELVYMFDVNIR